MQQQGVCGACYAFSVAAAMESALAIASGQHFLKLSEMDLIECASPPNVLCAGGDLDRARTRDRVLIGACNLMVCPIRMCLQVHGCRWRCQRLPHRWQSHLCPTSNRWVVCVCGDPHP